MAIYSKYTEQHNWPEGQNGRFYQKPYITVIKVDDVEFISIAEVLKDIFHMFKKLGKTTSLLSETMS